LATDPDREGEAIAWHLQRLLGKRKYFRVRCTEITESGIRGAVHNLSELRTETVDSQISRRLADRIIGYRISPRLWDIRSGLSAGRVQSVALKWIVHRERDIRKFIPEDYYEISLKTEVSGIPLLFRFVQKNNPSSAKLTEEEKNRILSEFRLTEIQSGKDAHLMPPAEIKIISQNDKIIKKYPPPAFTTSSLQKEAYARFRMPVAKTMRIAQKLYEGGTEKGGLITYMRTDSTRVSTERKNRALSYLKSEGYTDFFFRKQKDNASSQDAHEAIQPVNPYLDEKKLSNTLSRDELQIYSLIRNRFLESFLPPAVYREYKWTAESKGFALTASKEFCTDPGYLA
ncbi:MAG TPA: DNA topoisomerase, partial [Leptospiraceae bacterium]|nr:DNA topoisomerase [Leptospiraceae bacterium]